MYPCSRVRSSRFLIEDRLHRLPLHGLRWCISSSASPMAASGGTSLRRRVVPRGIPTGCRSAAVIPICLAVGMRWRNV
jgi:hypothetical protein